MSKAVDFMKLMLSVILLTNRTENKRAFDQQAIRWLPQGPSTQGHVENLDKDPLLLQPQRLQSQSHIKNFVKNPLLLPPQRLQILSHIETSRLHT